MLHVAFPPRVVPQILKVSQEPGLLKPVPFSPGAAALGSGFVQGNARAPFLRWASLETIIKNRTIPKPGGKPPLSDKRLAGCGAFYRVLSVRTGRRLLGLQMGNGSFRDSLDLLAKKHYGLKLVRALCARHWCFSKQPVLPLFLCAQIFLFSVPILVPETANRAGIFFLPDFKNNNNFSPSLAEITPGHRGLFLLPTKGAGGKGAGQSQERLLPAPCPAA